MWHCDSVGGLGEHMTFWFPRIPFFALFFSLCRAHASVPILMISMFFGIAFVLLPILEIKYPKNVFWGHE